MWDFVKAVAVARIREGVHRRSTAVGSAVSQK